MKFKILFILSLPRSGSTVLQKNLMSHKEIFSYSESWLLLPLFNLENRSNNLSSYSNANSSKAIEEHIKLLKNHDDFYKKHIKEFVTNFYRDISPKNTAFFIDKTPRYHLISEKLVRTFDDSKFIFLFRNPVEILSSMIEIWGKGKLYRLHAQLADLLYGPENLLNGYKKCNNAFYINYNSFTSNQMQTLKKIQKYLDLKEEFSKELVSIKSRFGDKGEFEQSKKIITPNPMKWTNTIDSYFRKFLYIKYAKKISEEYYLLCGVDKSNIINEIKKIRVGKLGIRDILDFIYSIILYKYNLDALPRIYRFKSYLSHWS